MTEQVADSGVAKIGHSIMTALGGLLTWLTAGWSGAIGAALAALLSLLGAVCSLVFSVLYARYLAVLGSGAEPKGSPERKAYGDLRDSFVADTRAGRLYVDWLTRFLDAVDRLLGDADKAARTLFPHAFGLTKPAPLWTAASFKCCLLLALIYPIVTIFMIWAVSGHVGPAEAALGLKSGLPGWSRGVMAAAVAFQGFAIWRFFRTSGWKSWTWLAVTFAVASAFVALGAVAGAFPFAGFVAVMVAIGLVSFIYAFYGISTAGHGAVLLAPFFVLPFAIAFAIAAALTFASAGASAWAIAGVSVLAFTATFILGLALILFIFFGPFRDEDMASLVLFLPVMILVCLDAAYLLAPLKIWEIVGPLLLFLGLLTLVNAPFNWASLGLTRALLRRGLELGGWWPFLLALVDAILAAIIVAALALAMIVAAQAFDGLAVHGGGKPVLPLDTLFNGIAAHPEAPEYWWVYALLLSTLLPSLINLMIGGASLMRGFPGVPSILRRFMPEGHAVPSFDRVWIALVLTFQVVGGAIAGALAQVLLAVAVTIYLMPWFGLGLLDMARDVAAFNLPARVGRLFVGGA